MILQLYSIMIFVCIIFMARTLTSKKLVPYIHFFLRDHSKFTIMKFIFIFSLSISMSIPFKILTNNNRSLSIRFFLITFFKYIYCTYFSRIKDSNFKRIKKFITRDVQKFESYKILNTIFPKKKVSFIQRTYDSALVRTISKNASEGLLTSIRNLDKYYKLSLICG